MPRTIDTSVIYTTLRTSPQTSYCSKYTLLFIQATVVDKAMLVDKSVRTKYQVRECLQVRL